MSDERLAKLRELREPFKPNQIGKLPKPVKKDAQRGKCNECGGYHGLPAVHLDFVGHAVITARLLDVDPEWTWEPVAWTERGTPATVEQGNNLVMWGRLTVCGVTRLGVGTAPKNKDEVHKELIGDFLRNAAMRFGLALDLWAKEDLDAEPESEPSPVANPEADRLRERIKKLNAAERPALRAHCEEHGIPTVVGKMTPEQVNAVHGLIDSWTKQALASLRGEQPEMYPPGQEPF